MAPLGRLEESRLALQRLRGPRFNIDKEFSRLHQSYQITQAEAPEKETSAGCPTRTRLHLLDLLRQLARPDVWKPLLIMTVLMFLQQWCGLATVTYYAVAVMTSTGTSVNAYTASIIFSLVRLAGTIIGSWLLR